MKTTNPPALQAAVFDMDGTLLDSMQMWANAPGVLLGRYGVQPPEGFIRRLIPLSARQCAVLMVEEYHLPVTPEQLAEQTAEYTRRQYAEHLQLKPGAKELVERFAARGVPMALASASSIRDVQAAMTRLGLWAIRLLFTTENAREVDRILEEYLVPTSFDPGACTRGLYLRGVE